MAGTRYQPQGVLRLNAAHSLARGLAGFWVPNGSGFRSVVAGVPDAAMTAAGRLVARPKGLAIATAGGASAVIANSARVKPPAAITALVDGFMPTSGYPLGCENSNDGWGIYSVSGVMRPYLRVGAAWADRATNIAPGASGQVGFTYDGATFWSVSNGKRHFDQAITGSITNSSVGIAINAMNPSGASAGNGMLHYFALWSRALSPDELASFHANPWQLFADLDEDDEFLLPAAVSGSITVTPASLLLGGGEVAMRVARRISTQPADMSLACGDGSLKASRKLGVQSASLSLTSGEAALWAARRLPVEPATASLASGGAGLIAARRLTVDAAALALEPGALQLRASRRLTVAPVAMAVTGSLIQFQYTPAPSAGSYVMPVTSATLALTGGNVSMRVTRRVSVTAAALGLSAGNVRLLAGYRLSVAPTALTAVTGQALLRADRRLQIEPAQLAVAGGAVTLRYSEQISYARAPAGSGYSPQRVEIQARPAQFGGSRPASIQRNVR